MCSAGPDGMTRQSAAWSSWQRSSSWRRSTPDKLGSDSDEPLVRVQACTNPCMASSQRGKLPSDMALPDNELLDFDFDRLDSFDPAIAAETLAGSNGDLYRSQLVVARWSDGWRERLFAEQDDDPEIADPMWRAGFEYATRQLSAHLRQGDFLPDGVLYVGEVGADEK